MPSTVVGGGDPAGGGLTLVSSAISANNVVGLVFRGLLTLESVDVEPATLFFRNVKYRTRTCTQERVLVLQS